MKTEYLHVDGVRSRVVSAGPSDNGEAVVFVHGNPGPLDDYDALFADLGEDVRRIAMDMPGYGDSDRPRDFDYTVEGSAAHLGGLLDQLDVDTAHLVLHDFGGQWGLRWAADHRDRLGSVTLINTGILVDYSWHKFARIWQTPILGEIFQATTIKPALRFLLNRDNPHKFPAEFVDRIWSHSDWGHRRAVLALYRACKDIDSVAQPLADAFRGDAVPTLVIWGDEDAYIPARFAEVQATIFPNAEIHHLPGLGHWPMIDDPAAVTSLTTQFLHDQLTHD
ncbi:MAG: alpha/beta fold hydrolase [Nitriliruptor sp.]|nr:MAG: alpha/beta fold hydrolase [Nitriliruptor sp.]